MTEYSLWLVPAADQTSTLGETISRLPALMPGVHFEPHDPGPDHATMTSTRT